MWLYLFLFWCRILSGRRASRRRSCRQQQHSLGVWGSSTIVIVLHTPKPPSKKQGKSFYLFPCRYLFFRLVIPSTNYTGNQCAGKDGAKDAQTNCHAESNQCPLPHRLRLNGSRILPRQIQNQANQRDEERQDVQTGPVEGLSTSTFLLATAQPQKGQTTALSETSLPQLLQYFISFSLFPGRCSPPLLYLRKQEAQAQGLRPLHSL